MKKRVGIGVAGNWIIDHVKIVDCWPEESALANILSQGRGTGGAPYNVAVGLRKLDPCLPIECIGLIGRDPDGEFILGNMRALHCNTRQLRQTRAAPTSYTDVMTVQGTGNRTFFHNRGANALFGIEHLDFDAINARIFHLGYLLLLDQLDRGDPEYRTVAARVLHNLRRRGIKTSVDVVSEDSQRFARIVNPALPHIDYLILNEFEACRTTGHQPRRGKQLDMAAIRSSARELLKRGVHELVVIHMPEGGYALERRGRETTQPSLDLPPGYIKGTVGAGDAFCAGVLYGLYRRWPIRKCLLLAACCGAACLSDPTCTAGMRSLAETLALAQQFPNRGQSPFSSDSSLNRRKR
ncbi:carbohydrate kinase family protein [Candidatus Sumerlaeota bacterium]|nr:carbohydrate kinase family protein [Candidatus Sumerlaeota bacterium]